MHGYFEQFVLVIIMLFISMLINNTFHFLFGIISAKRDVAHTSYTFQCGNVLICMTNDKLIALQLHDRYSDSQCVRRNV